jgi:hypothetical protein
MWFECTDAWGNPLKCETTPDRAVFLQLLWEDIYDQRVGFDDFVDQALGDMNPWLGGGEISGLERSHPAMDVVMGMVEHKLMRTQQRLAGQAIYDVTLADAGRHLGVSPQLVLQYIKRGKLDGMKTYWGWRVSAKALGTERK